MMPFGIVSIALNAAPELRVTRSNFNSSRPKTENAFA